MARSLQQLQEGLDSGSVMTQFEVTTTQSSSGSGRVSSSISIVELTELH